MTEPMTLLQTPGDLDKAPVGSIVCKRTVPYETLVVGIDTHETLVEALPLRVLRWGRFQYPTGFDDVALPTLADMTTEEREKCMFMQAVDRGGKLCTILYAFPSGVSVFYKDGTKGAWGLDSVIPRPDLPKLEWPSSEPEPEFSVGKKLETHEDFENAPIGTVAIDADGDIMHKKNDDEWRFPGASTVMGDKGILLWCSLPSKIIAVIGKQE
ncbi:hypothetical protein D9B85_05815 [Corynebacterium diphtheriae]|uniref:hypothetical protein n=1 Tax=Corynebacterium diphtheriae TaxID=1717 RepID=UPI0008932035|nr:hypothetical protein [Corynebacterium diphtheriae]AWR15506.1 hypothetical protein B11Q_00805 [Corynebacterium diphtheriae]MBG9296486.1 hypothetical protein [Corynebacterium diphtheriae bv. gravis]OFI51521.1 hypothetical protein BKD82_10215 [Corynebacterium diphtheriae]OFI61062.1 hypothetical protein BKD87_10175 [Corynebacterium diphtheriae]OSQ17087.1 hypothetical protein B1A54_10325 [Corynebacterium diphtheriae]